MQIETIDLQYRGVSRVIASYLVMGPEGPVLVETGPGSTLQTLLAGLDDHGVAPADVRHVLVTHIHLDHAGAAGWWAEQGATVYVHPFGATHLVDPSKLIASATRIYKGEMDALWGDILPAPPERVIPVQDGEVIEAAGLSITAIETPGHARHHHVYQVDDVVFTGDAAGIRFPDSPWIDVPAPPPEFDLQTWKVTINKIRDLEAETLYPTHYGATDEVAGQLDGLQLALEDVVEFVQSMMDEGLDRDQMIERYSQRLRDRVSQVGVSDDLAQAMEIANPKAMSLDGISRYLRKQADIHR